MRRPRKPTNPVTISPELYQRLWTFLDDAIGGVGIHCEPDCIDDADAIKEMLEAARKEGERDKLKVKEDHR